MKTRTRYLWIIPIILGLLFDFLFWEQTLGLNFSIYIGLCLAGGFVLMQMQGIKPSYRTLILAILIFFFSSVTYLKAEILTVFLGIVLSLFLMAEMAVTYGTGKWVTFGALEHFLELVQLLGGMIAKPFISLTAKRTPGEGANNTGKKKVAPVIRGILLAIPVLLIFSSLLSSADLVFAQQLESFTVLFRLEKLPEYMFRLTYILIAAYLLMGVFLHAAARSQHVTLSRSAKPLIPAFLGFIESGIILGSVVVLFSLFVAIQFKYFFGGDVNIHLDGYTYAEYARKGFGELVIVAVFSLFLIMGLSGVTRRENTVQQKVFSGLGIAIVVLVGVMLVSAYQRLVLYESAYGFSTLRTYTHVFMIWLAVLLLAVMILEIIRKEKLFTISLILVVIGFAASLVFLNVDGFIVRQNVERARIGQDLDVGYLASLGSDAVPALVDLFSQSTIPIGIREQVGASLVCMSTRMEEQNDFGWQSYNYSHSKAEKLISSLQNKFSDYIIETKDYQIQVTTPSGEKWDCMGNSYMD